MTAPQHALTIHQPDASLVMYGRKPVENRGWTPHLDPPFDLWVHASQRFDSERWHAAIMEGGRQLPAAAHWPLGCLLGVVTVTDVHHADECGQEEGMRDTLVGPQYEPEAWCSRWAHPDVYHWTLADPRPLPRPVPMAGAQRLWKLSDAALDDLPPLLGRLPLTATAVPGQQVPPGGAAVQWRDPDEAADRIIAERLEQQGWA